MSRWLSKADALSAHLLTLPDLTGVEIFVHRDGDLLAQVNSQVEKAAGQGCVVIKWLGGKNPDRKSNRLRMGARYSVSLWTLPLLAETATAAPDDLVEAMASHLHGWVDPRPGAMILRLEVESIELVPDAPGYVVHEILAEFAGV